MPPTLQEEHTPTDRRNVLALIDLVPDTWEEIVLEIERTEPAEGGETLALSIQNPAGRREVVTPNEELINGVRALSLVFARHGTPWQSVRYHLTRDPEGAWDYRVQFAYPPSGATESAAAPVPNENHRRFVDTMHRYLSQAYPEDLADLGEEKIREVIELGVDIAAGYDIEIERDVGYYIDLMFQYGFVFQDEPEMKWAKKILRHKRLTGTEKMAQIRQALRLD